jgi:hypothetical protein
VVVVEAEVFAVVVVSKGGGSGGGAALVVVDINTSSTFDLRHSLRSTTYSWKRRVC